MNISYNWLKDLVETKMSPAEMAKKLTGAGLAVEGIEEKDGDFIFDIDLTSNRSDCLSHLGIAREVGVIENTPLKLGKTDALSAENTAANLVTIEDADICQRFTARLIHNVKIGESPEWLKKRLEAVGERSINNVADITNYVMHELGQPMHSFDFNKLAENRIVVRRARPGETIKTLDEAERKLDETMLAICDAEKPVAVAGVMGGFDSGINAETTDVLLEVAYFQRDNIRQTSRKLKLSTEASHRFERGVDIENLIRASNRATALICELAGGTAGEFVDVYPTKFTPKEIESQNIGLAVKRLTGLDVAEADILRILNALGISEKTSSENQTAKVFVSPSWRHDIAIEEDLVEEVARIVGYDKIAEELPPSLGAGEYQPTELRKFQLRQTLATLGFDEAISYSFIDTKNDEKFEFVPNLIENEQTKFVELRNSVIEGAIRMRPSLLSGMLEAVRLNFNHQERNLRLFEIGKVFSAATEKGALPNEREILALVVTGSETLQNKAMTLREFDFYDIKGALESAIAVTNAPKLEFVAREIKHLRKGQSAEIRLGGSPVGTIGRLNDEISSVYKFRQPVFVAEVDLQKILEAKQTAITYRPLPVLPSVIRDVSLLVKRSTSFAEIAAAIEKSDSDILQNVEFVDVYEGKGMADDERSLTLRLVYRDDKETLRDEDVDKAHSLILKDLEAATGAKSRF